MLRPLILTLCIVSTLTVSFTGSQAAEPPAAAEITSPSSTLRADAASTEATVQRPSVTFNHAIHFIAGEGSDVQLSPGTYGVEQAGQERLRLVPSDSQPPIEIQATNIPHEEGVSSPIAMAVIEEGQDDQVHLVLVLPGGQALDAAGTFSGTRSRATVSSTLNYTQVQYAVSQFKVTPQQSMPLFRVPPAAAASKVTPPAESVENSGPGKWVTWNYLYMHHPEIVAQALADVQTSKQPRTSVAGLASGAELNDMLKTNWSAEVSRLNAAREAGMTQPGVTPRGLPGGLSLSDQVTAVNPQKSPLSDQFTAVTPKKSPLSDQFTAVPQKTPLSPFLKALPVQLPTRNLGSVWAGQRAMAIVSITAPADGYVEGRFNLNATNRHFRIVNAIAYTGEVVNKTLAVSLIIPGGQYQDVVLDPANPPAQISKAGFVSILANKGQRIDFTIAFEPVGLGMTPVGDNEATLQLSGATSSEINILSNAPATTWMRTASIRARFEGINFGVLGAIDDTAITVFYDGTPCGRVIPVPASITFFNAEQQVRSVSVTAELSHPLHMQAFTVSVAPGERKQVPIPIQIDSCPNLGVEYMGRLSYAYADVVRHAEFGVTLYPDYYHWSNGNSHGSVGSCDYTWDIFIRSDGNTHFAYSLRNRNLIYSKQLDLRFLVLGQEIGRGVLQDGPNTVHTKMNGYTIPSSFVRDNFVPMLTAPAQVRLSCHSY
jgi:hypothetical protein